MNKLRSLTLLALISSLALAAGSVLAGEAATPNPAKKLKVLVVAGGHGYPVPPFRAIFEGYGDMECTFVDEKIGGEAFEDLSNCDYDVILLYNYMKNLSDKPQENFLKLMDKGVGLVILHHAIYGYRPWPEFMKIVGVTSWLSGAKDDVDIQVHIEDPDHPITKGLSDFSINDETYQGHGLEPKAHVLLSTDTPGNAKGIAWVHAYRKSPVCYFQLGHGPSAYGNESFRAILGRAIRWTAGQLK